jgi:hypothetical protein
MQQIHKTFLIEQKYRTKKNIIFADMETWKKKAEKEKKTVRERIC